MRNAVAGMESTRIDGLRHPSSSGDALNITVLIDTLLIKPKKRLSRRCLQTVTAGGGAPRPLFSMGSDLNTLISMGGSWTSTWPATDVLDEESGCLGPRQPPELDPIVLSAMDLSYLPPWA